MQQSESLLMGLGLLLLMQCLSGVLVFPTQTILKRHLITQPSPVYPFTKSGKLLCQRSADLRGNAEV